MTTSWNEIKMLKLKQKKLLVKIALALLGMVYFSLFSSWEIHPFLKGYVAIMPVQALALIYVVYFFWKS